MATRLSGDTRAALVWVGGLVTVLALAVFGTGASAAPGDPIKASVATLVGSTETLTDAGTYYVTATLRWTAPRRAQSIGVCYLNVNSGGGGCMGVEPTTTEYTTTPELVGEILSGTKMVYTIEACDGSCSQSNKLKVFVPVAATPAPTTTVAKPRCT